MIAKIYSAIPDGYDGHIIEVEGSSAKSLPTLNIVGMATKTVSEARERVRSAITNSDFIFPAKKITINLAPAELTKDGSHLDLPIALAILTLSKQLTADELKDKLFVGELSLSGQSKPIRGAVNITEAAQKAGFKEIYVPQDNSKEATLISGITVYGFDSLTNLVLHLKGIQPLPSCQTSVSVKNTYTDTPTLDDVHGQELAKRALTIAIAGHHNLLLSGPPGAGKTLLAQVARGLLPPMSASEQIAVTKIYTSIGSPGQIITARPFRSPHHTASSVSLIGGGSQAQPGEISLSHSGILFLDELPEFPRNVIEALRQPLEDHQITISRANRHTTYPANFILIATMNPCPCGYLNDPSHECTCTLTQIEQYRKRISGPILDRIDLILNLEKIAPADITSSVIVKNNKTDQKCANVSSKITNQNVRNTQTDNKNQHQYAISQIQSARHLQQLRYQADSYYNNDLSPQSISNYVKITPTGEKLLNTALTSLNLSARAYYKLIKVSQTIADLDNASEIKSEHISEAISIRQTLL